MNGFGLYSYLPSSRLAAGWLIPVADDVCEHVCQMYQIIVHWVIYLAIKLSMLVYPRYCEHTPGKWHLSLSSWKVIQVNFPLKNFLVWLPVVCLEVIGDGEINRWDKLILFDDLDVTSFFKVRYVFRHYRIHSGLNDSLVIISSIWKQKRCLRCQFDACMLWPFQPRYHVILRANEAYASSFLDVILRRPLFTVFICYLITLIQFKIRVRTT